MKKILMFCSMLFLAVMVLGLLPVAGEEEIYSGVVRLHVLANSDSREDQELKLRVRDEVLETVSGIVAGAESKAEAEAMLSKEESLAMITDAAEKRIRLEGYDYEACVTIGEEDYPRRSYENLCFPSGRYTSLRVEIGESEGKNWWCVLFPRLCLGAATVSSEQAFVEAGFTPEQYMIVTDTDKPEYEVRFKILEIIEGLVN